jgi:aldehyde:ferredoxin oxidoreductase
MERALPRVLGWNKKVLEVDLSNGSSREIPLPERLLELYLGGKGLALKLFFDMVEPGVPPLSDEEVFI